ncbi:MAG: aminotransferase class I/II-fold pyridoxal phosphate-dependent enzyme [Bacteroidia bacterium]|nr:aminotransferase class I/II-fold pyridoxal phosphate-dependent enzyme [Bacteroidia bacterium]
MNTINRREWLKSAGLGGAFTLLGGASVLAHPATPVVSPPAGPIRLQSNENPYGPSEAVRKALMDGFEQMCRYPYDMMRETAAMIAARHGVSPEHIVLTVGSGEGLHAAGLAYGLHGGEIIAAQPTFLALMEYAQRWGAYIHYVPLDANLGHDLEAMAQRITHRTSLVFVCNPNNPSGTLLPADRMRDFCASVSGRTVVLADEAYFDYITEPGYPSMIELVKQGMNVIVSRTLSKVYGMAGMRIGYLVARPDIAQRLRAHTMATVSIPAMCGAQAALRDTEFYAYSLKQNAEALRLLYETLDDLKLRYVRSHANFVFFDTKQPVTEFNDRMAQKGILTGRPFPPFMTWSRVSTGRLEDVKTFCKVLRDVV